MLNIEPLREVLLLQFIDKPNRKLISNKQHKELSKLNIDLLIVYIVHKCRHNQDSFILLEERKILGLTIRRIVILTISFNKLKSTLEINYLKK